MHTNFVDKSDYIIIIRVCFTLSEFIIIIIIIRAQYDDVDFDKNKIYPARIFTGYYFIFFVSNRLQKPLAV